MCHECTNKRWDFQGKFWGQRICSRCRYELRVKSATASVRGCGCGCAFSLFRLGLACASFSTPSHLHPSSLARFDRG